LNARITELAKQTGSKDPNHWYWLARAYEAERQLKEAGQAIGKASELAPQSVPIHMASARIFESQNNLLAAVEINTKLAAIDRRYRTEYLKQVATLEQKLDELERLMLSVDDFGWRATLNDDAPVRARWDLLRQRLAAAKAT
jgi:lipopolysaccharide biosynthesis regulator YciM